MFGRGKDVHEDAEDEIARERQEEEAEEHEKWRQSGQSYDLSD